MPVFEYDHSLGCSVTGGQVYRGRKLPSFSGMYLFGDFCSGTVWGLLRQDDQSWRGQVLFETEKKITGFGSDEAGELYLLDFDGGLYRLEAKQP